LKNHPYKFNGIEIEYHLTDNNFIEFYFNPNEDINYYEYTLFLGIELFCVSYLGISARPEGLHPEAPVKEVSFHYHF
jgi:hypothetical protein